MPFIRVIKRLKDQYKKLKNKKILDWSVTQLIGCLPGMHEALFRLQPSVVSVYVCAGFCQLEINWSHPFIRLACMQICRAFSSLMIAMKGPCPLAMTLLATWCWV